MLIAPLWPQGQGVALIDQTLLPFKREVIQIRTADEMAEAIRRMQIRGSGAIGCAGAMGAYLAVRNAPHDSSQWSHLVQALRTARPTAVALQQAVDEVLAAANDASEPVEAVAEAAATFVEQQLLMERAIGRYGAQVIPDGATVLTHCHSGALAGAGYGGRALSVIRAAARQEKISRSSHRKLDPIFRGHVLRLGNCANSAFP